MSAHLAYGLEHIFDIIVNNGMSFRRGTDRILILHEIDIHGVLTVIAHVSGFPLLFGDNVLNLKLLDGEIIEANNREVFCHIRQLILEPDDVIKNLLLMILPEELSTAKCLITEDEKFKTALPHALKNQRSGDSSNHMNNRVRELLDLRNLTEIQCPVNGDA